MTSTSPDLGATLLRGAAAATVEPARFDEAMPTVLDPVPFERRRLLRRASDRAALDAGSARSFTEVVEEARAAAQADGWKVGHAEGLAAAADDIRRLEQELQAAHEAAEAARAATVTQALAALARAADELVRARTAETDGVVDLAVDAAIELAEALVAHDLAARGTPGLDAVRRAAAAAPRDGAMIARLHPTDAAVVGDLVDARALGRDITVVPDAMLAPGDCIAEVDNVEVDASVRSALARAREALRG
jgi:flagellar assembly protein FliH